MRRWSPVVLLLAACAHLPPEPLSPPVLAFTDRVQGSGRAVVLVPDLATPAELWDTTAAHLAGRYQIHVLDLAGFAGNPEAPGPLMPRLREELARHLRHQGLREVVVVGQLFGASVAYWLAMTDPELVAGVVAIDAPPSRFEGTVDPEVEEVRAALVAASPSASRSPKSPSWWW